MLNTLLVQRPDAARAELLVGFERDDGEEVRARFTVPASAGMRAGDPVRVVRRPDGTLRLARSPRPGRPASRWWPPPDLRTGAWGLALIVVAALLVAGIAWIAVNRQTSSLPTAPPSVSPSAGAPTGPTGPAGQAGPTGSAVPTPTGSATSEAPYEPGR